MNPLVSFWWLVVEQRESCHTDPVIIDELVFVFSLNNHIIQKDMGKSSFGTKSFVLGDTPIPTEKGTKRGAIPSFERRKGERLSGHPVFACYMRLHR